MRDRATRWLAQWTGLTLASDVVRLLDDLDTATARDIMVDYDSEALLADLASAENRARTAENIASLAEQHLEKVFGKMHTDRLRLMSQLAYAQLSATIWQRRAENLAPPGADPLKESGGSTAGDPGRPPQSTGGDF